MAQGSSTRNAWNTVAKSFHWSVALLIFVAATLGLLSENADLSPGKLQLFAWHKSVGITVLGVMVLRLIWKIVSRNPEAASGLSGLNQTLSLLGHWLIYVVAIILPLSGWVVTSAANISFQWFGLFAFPMPWSADELLKQNAALTHFYLFFILLVLILGHVGMAFKHQLAGIPILQRILPPKLGAIPALILIISLAVAWVAFAWVSSYPSYTNQEQGVSRAPFVERKPVIPVELKSVDSSATQVWNMVADESTLALIGTYGGIDFNGSFANFEPLIAFQSDKLDQSIFDVSIDITSVSTGSPDINGSVHEEAWFDFSGFPQSTYKATGFEQLESNRFLAKGVLKLKGVEGQVNLAFDWQEIDENQAILQGNALVNRLDFGIGSGDWAEDSTIGFDVDVVVNLILEKNPGD